VIPTAKKQKQKKDRNPLLDTLQDLLIIQLAHSNIDNHSIRKIVGVQMSRVTRVSKALKKAQRKTKKGKKGSANG
jgi:hypothetical protein